MLSPDALGKLLPVVGRVPHLGKESGLEPSDVVLCIEPIVAQLAGIDLGVIGIRQTIFGMVQEPRKLDWHILRLHGTDYFLSWA